MGVYTEAVQKLYVAYFSRPADAAGLVYWENVVAKANGNTAAVSAAFAASAEYKEAFAGQSTYQIINTIYMNLFGRAAESAALTFWGQGLLNGSFTIDNAVTAIAAGAQSTDLVAYNSKVAAATAFTAALDTAPELIGYSGATANVAAKAWLAGVTTDATLKAAIETSALDATVTKVITPVVAPVNFSLTTGVDTFTGGAGNDVITATTTTGVNALTAFDVIDGGAGIDTIRFVDTGTAATAQYAPATSGATVKNVELVNISTTGGLNLNTKTWTGVTDITATTAGTAAVAVTAADSTNVIVGSSAASTNGVSVTGGKAVNVSLTDATAGAVSVIGAGLTTVSVKGGDMITVDNQSSTAATGKGTTLTAVTLDGVKGGATVSGASLTSVSLNNITSAQTVTVNNATASHTLNVAATAAGYNGSTAAPVTVVDAAATTVAFNVASKSSLALNAAAATKVTVAGAGDLALNLADAQAKLTTVDGAAATGGITLTNLGTGVSSVTTGAGKDVVTLTTATKAAATGVAAVNATVSTGAGDDKIVVSTTGNGSVTVDAGAGNDTITIAQSLLVAGNKIDGGADNDTLILGNITTAFAAGDYALINSTVSNIEAIEFSNAVGGVDASKLAFTSMAFKGTAIVSGVSTQTLTTSATALDATAAGFVAGATTTYAGNLNVTTTGATSALTLKADTATVAVKASTTNAANATIGGSLKTALTVNLTNAANASTSPTGDNLSTATVMVDASNNVALKSVVLTGAGSVVIDASASTALSSVDASQLGGTIANGSTKGAITGGLTFTGNTAIVETVTLGSGKDTVTVASTYAKMDKIVGFDAVKEGSTSASVTDVLVLKAAAIGQVADLTINGMTALTTGQTATTGMAKMTLGAGDTTLELAFVHAASIAAGNVVQFQFGGNTYLFADTNNDGVLNDTDFAVELVGIVDVAGAFGLPPA